MADYDDARRREAVRDFALASIATNAAWEMYAALSGDGPNVERAKNVGRVCEAETLAAWARIAKFSPP